MIADANILLRTIDGPRSPLHERATRLIRDALDRDEEVRVRAATLHEVIYVLSSKVAGYGLSPDSIAGTVADLLDTAELSFESPDTMRLAAELYGATGIDFHDCYLAAIEHLTGEPVISLDDDIDRLRQRFQQGFSPSS